MNVFLYIWIVFTVTISILDLALGIQFAVDYDTIIVNDFLFFFFVLGYNY